MSFSWIEIIITALNCIPNIHKQKAPKLSIVTSSVTCVWPIYLMVKLQSGQWKKGITERQQAENETRLTCDKCYTHPTTLGQRVHWKASGRRLLLRFWPGIKNPGQSVVGIGAHMTVTPSLPPSLPTTTPHALHCHYPSITLYLFIRRSMDGHAGNSH